MISYKAGAPIAAGGFGCVFRPPLKCKKTFSKPFFKRMVLGILFFSLILTFLVLSAAKNDI